MKTAKEWFDENSDSSDLNGSHFWLISASEIEDIQRDAVSELVSAMKEVQIHRKEDQDGNYVMWIGEGTFLRCQQALDALNSKLNNLPLPSCSSVDTAPGGPSGSMKPVEQTHPGQPCKTD